MIGSFFETNGITIICMIYIVLIILMYFVKGKARNISGKVFLALLFTTVITMLGYISWGTCAVKELPFTGIVGKISSFIVVCWNMMLIFYISIAFKTEEENKEYYQKHDKISYVLGSILVITNLLFIIFLDFETIKVDKLYSMGGAVSLYLDITGGIAIIYAIVTLILNRKKLDKMTPILATLVIIIATGSILLGITGVMKLNDICFLHTVVVMFLYLSLESQDRALLAEFNESNKKAKESNQLKSEFIMNMSHQLRTPMNTILGFSDSLLTTENLTESALIIDSQNIELASKRLLDLINSILDISRIESNKEVLNNENYTLDSVIYDISSNINSKINKENIVFTINANSNCPNDLFGDPYKISKILNVVLSNAIKNTEYGEISLNVSSSVVDAENHEFTFHIKNTGHAMKIENFERNFDELMRLNSKENNDIDADTLKIIAAKGLLNILGGKIDFINQTGQGTQYIIKINQKVTTQNELGNIREKIQVRQEMSQEKLDLLGKKVLIIDDTKINSIILQRLLKNYKVEVEETSNPRDGLEKANNTTYDIIFVNHEMEDMSGLEVIKKLELSGNKLPTIIGLLSGAVELNDAKKYTETLNCPIEYRQLNKILKKIYK